MNPAFWLIVIILLGALWVAICNIFPAIGARFFKIKDTVQSNIETKETNNAKNR